MVLQKVVLFDLWMTLVYSRDLDEDPIKTTHAWLAGSAGSEPDPEFFRLCLTTNATKPGAFLEQVARASGCSAGSEAKQKFRRLLSTERRAAALYEETMPVLENLKAKGYRLGLISNLWPFAAHRILNQMGLSNYFEHMLLSYKEGIAKPDSRIFSVAAQRFGVAPHDCVMVGDSLKSDVIGAVNAGMHAYHLDRAGSSTRLPANATSIANLTALTASAAL